MAKVKVVLDKDIRTVASMEGLDHIVIGDCPSQLGGLGEHMSATDLCSASLGACMLTMMGLAAKQLKVDLTGTTVEVTKKMISDPLLRFSGFTIAIHVPTAVDDALKEKLEKAAKHCPIHLSLRPDIHQDISFIWG